MKISFLSCGRLWEALVVSYEQIKHLLNVLPNNIELEYDEDTSKEISKSVFCLVAHGSEPLIDIQKLLLGNIIKSYDDMPSDIGHDTDADNICYNGIYLVVQ